MKRETQNGREGRDLREKRDGRNSKLWGRGSEHFSLQPSACLARLAFPASPANIPYAIN
ncbi:MAG: hypothetical protein WCH20_10610 [Nitrospira sp.]